MQPQLALNDIRPRPRIHSTAVYQAAAEAFLLSNELSQVLTGFSASDEEWLRESFIDAATGSSSDTWKMASNFASEIDDTVCEEYVELFESWASHLGKWQEQVLRDWIASGGAVNPLAGEVCRVQAETPDGMKGGIAFNDPGYAATGRFSFLSDDDRRISIDGKGEIVRLSILEWERVRAVESASAEDLSIWRADQAAKKEREERNAQAHMSREADRRRDAFLAENKVQATEAAVIFDSLGFADEAEAARAANAILLVLAERRRIPAGAGTVSPA